jgi:predicted nucleotidyltransferase
VQKIYVFGSVVRGLYTVSSDIDILIITENVNLKYDSMVAVYRELIDAPIQLHVVTP